MDAKGRVWVTARIRAPQQQPAFCKDGATNKFAKYFPLPGPSNRQIQLYDPKSKQFTPIDSCFAADHNLFDEHDALVFGQENAIGWVDTVAFDKTRDGAASQAWCPGVIDTNGDGKVSTGWSEPNEPIDPKTRPPDRVRMLLDRHQPDRRQPSGVRASNTKTRRSYASSEGRIRRCRARPKSTQPPPSTIPLPYSGGLAVAVTAWCGRTGGASTRSSASTAASARC